jgi:hypothetical protein
MTPVKPQDLYTRAILVGLRISSFSARKFDKKVTKETAEARGASADAGRWNKNLFPGSEVEVPAPSSAKKKKANAAADVVNKSNSHKRLTAHLAAFRVWHYEQTLPWSDDGWRVLPVANHKPYTDGSRDWLATAEALLQEFVADYPHLKATAKKLLNGDFDESEYPEDIREKFKFKIDWNRVPETGDWRVSLPASELAAISASIEAQVKDGLQEAQNDAVKRLYDVLAKIHTRLTDTKVTKDRTTKDRTLKKDKYDKTTGALIPAGTVIAGRFLEGGEVRAGTYRDSLIENARDLCDVLKRLNIADDPELERFRRETALLAMSEPETLRKSEAVRVETAERAESILQDMAKTYGKGLFKK